MKPGRNRHERKDDAGRERTTQERSGFALLACGLLVLIAVIAAPAASGATTGGLSTATSDRAKSSAGFAFSPLRRAGATWYGPGLYGNRTACGQTLRPQTVGVAHRSLPCGTPVRFVYRGRSLVARVIDRGPFSRGYSWDLTNGARLALGFEGSSIVRYAVAMGNTRR
jgi:rare lipoprotein A (peptidoglycan hydrolase)